MRKLEANRSPPFQLQEKKPGAPGVRLFLFRMGFKPSLAPGLCVEKMHSISKICNEFVRLKPRPRSAVHLQAGFEAMNH